MNKTKADILIKNRETLIKQFLLGKEPEFLARHTSLIDQYLFTCPNFCTPHKMQRVQPSQGHSRGISKTHIFGFLEIMVSMKYSDWGQS